MLNEKGGIECDVTITVLDVNKYYIVTGTGFMTHDFNWINSNIPSGYKVDIKNITYDNSAFALMGPKSREILQGLTNHDLSNENFPFGTCQKIKIGNHDVNAIRITYMGELGWELHFPIAQAKDVYENIMDFGKNLGLVNAGYRCIESCRLEKGYRAWGSDIGPDHTPLEAGLGWATKLNSEIDFIGKQFLLEQKKKGLMKIFAGFTCDDPNIILLGRETIFRNGKQVGWLSSGGYGYTIGKPIGYGYIRSDEIIDKEFVKSGKYELEIATEKVSCSVHLSPLYDEKMLKIKS
jgi:4-methylaminobutanoate oxidase (formaldehyde-forming)